MENLTPAAKLAAKGRSPFPGESDAYRKARQVLLEDEIEFRRHMTRLAEQRRALPEGPIIAKDYRFIDENGAELGLKELFGDKNTLVTYFWMYGPQRARPCPMCTNWLGGVNGNGADIKQRVAFKILGRSPVERQLPSPASAAGVTLILFRRSATSMRTIWASSTRMEVKIRRWQSSSGKATRSDCSGQAR